MRARLWVFGGIAGAGSAAPLAGDGWGVVDGGSGISRCRGGGKYGGSAQSRRRGRGRRGSRRGGGWGDELADLMWRLSDGAGVVNTSLMATLEGCMMMMWGSDPMRAERSPAWT
jgi:hypothetical protein